MSSDASRIGIVRLVIRIPGLHGGPSVRLADLIVVDDERFLPLVVAVVTHADGHGDHCENHGSKDTDQHDQHCQVVTLTARGGGHSKLQVKSVVFGL